MKVLAILLFLIAVVFAVLYFDLKRRIVKVEDTVPEKPTKRNMVMKLQNELKPYIERNENKVFLLVVKPKK